MAIAVKIDFNNTYEIDSISEDLKTAIFSTELLDASIIHLKVEIDNEEHELLPNVYNLAFGPMDNKGKIEKKYRH